MGRGFYCSLAALAVYFCSAGAVFSVPEASTKDLQAQQLAVMQSQLDALNSIVAKLNSNESTPSVVEIRNACVNLDREMYVLQFFVLVGLGGFMCYQFFVFLRH